LTGNLHNGIKFLQSIHLANVSNPKFKTKINKSKKKLCLTITQYYNYQNQPKKSTNQKTPTMNKPH
ncbi:hypothetical protein Q6312_27870, partial [Klebsiella pneumoniae]|uniref:hypothetical protein n=1 Tax=Klebsiella pneumoniae TaxID=573 RepID=UPI00272FD994